MRLVPRFSEGTFVLYVTTMLKTLTSPFFRIYLAHNCEMAVFDKEAQICWGNFQSLNSSPEVLCMVDFSGTSTSI